MIYVNALQTRINLSQIGTVYRINSIQDLLNRSMCLFVIKQCAVLITIYI